MFVKRFKRAGLLTTIEYCGVQPTQVIHLIRLMRATQRAFAGSTGPRLRYAIPTAPAVAKPTYLVQRAIVQIFWTLQDAGTA